MAVGTCNKTKLLMETRSRERKSERERRVSRIRHSPQGHAPNDLLVPTSPHILKFTEHPKIVPPTGDKAFNT
jgi:hypothetical protein